MTGPQITFSRRIDLPFGDSLEAIARWRPVPASTGAGRGTIEAVGGGRRYRVAVRPGRLGRSVPMELTLSPWAGPATTHLELVPLRSVRPRRRYFECGRALLDDAVTSLAATAEREEVTLARSA